VVALSVSQEVIALARLVVLARLLSPNDFGLAGIAVLTLATVDTFTQPNFETALIQTRREIRPYLDSAWTAGILRGIAASALTFLVAPYAAAFFRAPESVPLIRAIALAVLAKSFTNIGSVYFRKELEFRKQFVWQFGGRLADFACSREISPAARERNQGKNREAPDSLHKHPSLFEFLFRIRAQVRRRDERIGE